MQANFAKWQKESAQDVIEQAHKTLCAEVGEAPPEVRTGVLYSQSSHVVPTLIDASKQARIVVAGSRGMGAVGPLWMGSVSTALVHHAHCPGAVIRGEEASAANQNAGVLVGIHGSPASAAATAWAFDEASHQGLPLVALHAWNDVGGFPILDMDWRKLPKPRRESRNRTPGWLAGTVSQRARAATAGMGSARPQARRGIRARSAGGGRQSRSRRIRWHAAGLGRRRGGAIGKSSGGRRPHPVGRFGTLNGTCSRQPHRAAARNGRRGGFRVRRSRHDADDSGEHPLLGTGLTHSPLLFLVKSVSRLGCTRFGSPGIFGVPPC